MGGLANAESAIMAAIKSEIDRQREKVIEEAVAEFEEKVRKAVGQVVLQLSDYYSVERLGAELVIHVKIEGETKPR